MKLAAVLSLSRQFLAAGIAAILITFPAVAAAQSVRRITEVAEIAPSRTSEHAAAFDEARGVMVVFGSDGEADGTWGWAGERWMRLASAEQSPPHRRSAVMAYDTSRQVVVLHGGTTSAGVVLNDTWEWNGTAWTQVNVSGPARSDHTMVYDSARHRIVLFGGESSGGTDPSRLSAQVWEYDGAAWILMSDPAPSAWVPTARHKQAASFDSIRNVMVMFGGVDAIATRRDTWEWNGSSWNQRLFPMRNAESSESIAMAFDPDRGISVVCSESHCWALCNDGWRLLGTGKQRSAHSPSMVFDTTHRTLVLCGQIDQWPYRHLATLNAPILSKVEGIGSPQCLYTDSSFSADPDLYVGGMRWDGMFFQSLGPGIGSVNTVVRMRMPDGSTPLVFGGNFGFSGSTTLNRVVRWDGSNFASFASGVNGAVNDIVTVPNANGSDDLVIVGAFTSDVALGTPLVRAARWDGSAWSQVGDGLPQGTNDVAAVTDAGGQTTIYASGTFTPGLNGQSLSKLAQFTGGTWGPVGQGVNGSVNDLEVMRNSDGVPELYVAGEFSTIGTPSVANLAKWNGQQWSPLGDGPGASVDAITVIRRAGEADRLLVATSLSGTITRLQEWDGSNWTFLGDITSSALSDLNLFPICGAGDELFVSGGMTAEQGVAYLSRLTNCGWTIRYPTAWPEARLARNFAYDPDRHVLVLVAGAGAENAIFSDTWEFNGEFWTKTDVASPMGVYRSEMAYDPIRQKMVIYGGYDGVTVSSTTWEYDGHAWVARSLPGPGPRQRHSMAFDSEHGVMVLFGGNNAGSAYLGDTWTYDGTAWSLANAGGPGGRRYPAMAFDPSNGQMLLYGGYGPSQCLRDTWAWNGASWTPLSVDGPLSVELAAMAWDPHSQRMFLTGGSCATNNSKAAAEWTGQEWLVSSTAPSRTSMALSFYPPMDAIVSFGGATTSYSGTLSFFNDFTAFPAACVHVEPPPTPAVVCAGHDLEIPMAASGQTELSYVWQYSQLPVRPADITAGTNPQYGSVESAEASTLVLRNVPATADGTRITCIVTSGDCIVTSRAVQLSVLPSDSPLCPTCPPCPADFDANGGVEPGDIAAFFVSYEAGDGCADVDNDGGVTASDLAAFFTVYEAGGC